MRPSNLSFNNFTLSYVLHFFHQATGTTSTARGAVRHHRPAPWESLVRALDFNLSANRIGAPAIGAQIDEIRAQNRGA